MSRYTWLRSGGIVIFVLLFHIPDLSLPAQEGNILPGSPNSLGVTSSVHGTEGELFFADILVRGQPVFQVGSVASLSAAERAQIINRRIAGVLSRSKSPDTVTTKFDPERQVVLLQVNNRVLMTVTQQDALDFDATVEALARKWAESLNRSLAQPTLAIDVLQRLSSTARQFASDTISLLPSLLGALLIVGSTWMIARGVRRVGVLWAEQTEGDRSSEILIGRLCYGGVWTLGSIVALTVLGLDFATLLGTLGLTSVAIGFSLKDVLSNYISGVILLAARPFRISDQVVIGDYEGTIVQIQLRATTMRTYDGRLVYIPNQEVFQRSITNNTASPVRRSDVTVGIDYDADVQAVREIIERAIVQVEGVEVDPLPLILVQELAASTVNLKVRFWVNSRQRSFLQVTSAVTQAIKEQLQGAKVEMPTEIYTLMFRDKPIELQAAIVPADREAEKSREAR